MAHRKQISEDIQSRIDDLEAGVCSRQPVPTETVSLCGLRRWYPAKVTPRAPCRILRSFRKQPRAAATGLKTPLELAKIIIHNLRCFWTKVFCGLMKQKLNCSEGIRRCEKLFTTLQIVSAFAVLLHCGHVSDHQKYVNNWQRQHKEIQKAVFKGQFQTNPARCEKVAVINCIFWESGVYFHQPNPGWSLPDL